MHKNYEYVIKQINVIYFTKKGSIAIMMDFYVLHPLPNPFVLVYLVFAFLGFHLLVPRSVSKHCVSM